MTPNKKFGQICRETENHDSQKAVHFIVIILSAGFKQRLPDLSTNWKPLNWKDE